MIPPIYTTGADEAIEVAGYSGMTGVFSILGAPERI